MSRLERGSLWFFSWQDRRLYGRTRGRSSFVLASGSLFLSPMARLAGEWLAEAKGTSVEGSSCAPPESWKYSSASRRIHRHGAEFGQRHRTRRGSASSGPASDSRSTARG